MAAVHIVELLAPTKPFHGDAFPSLESLEVDNMQFLEMFGENDETRHSYPSLRVVSIKRCPKLGKVSFGSIPSLKDLTIEECPQAVLKDLVGVSSSIHTLKLEEIKGLTQLDTEVLKHLGAVEDLSIKGCQELEACRFHGNAFPSLKSLEVDDMQSSEIFGDNDETSQSFPSIRAISIKMCPKLGKVSFGLIPSLEDLTIEGCAEVVLRDLVGASSSMRTLKLDAIKGMTQLDNEVLG